MVVLLCWWRAVTIVPRKQKHRTTTRVLFVCQARPKQKHEREWERRSSRREPLSGGGRDRKRAGRDWINNDDDDDDKEEGGATLAAAAFVLVLSPWFDFVGIIYMLFHSVFYNFIANVKLPVVDIFEKKAVVRHQDRKFKKLYHINNINKRWQQLV